MLIRILFLGIMVGGLGACGTASLNSSVPSTQSLGSAVSTGSTGSITTASLPDSDAKRQLQEMAARAEAANKVGTSGYKVGPQDVLDVSVFKVPELTKTVHVSEAGTINYPLIGETPASGKTARELEQELTAKLGANYLQNPQVSVQVREHNSKRVTIEGAVGSPGVYPLQGDMTLLQLIATAKGLKQDASDDVVLFRQENGQKKAARFALSELRAGTSPDPQLMPGDVIIANTSMTQQFFNGVLRALPVASFFLLF